MKSLLLTGVVFLVGSIATNGQAAPTNLELPTAPKPSYEFRLAELSLLSEICSMQPVSDKCAGRNVPKETSDLLMEMVRDKMASKVLLNAAMGANLAVLQRIEVVQNQRIIELLELLLQKK